MSHLGGMPTFDPVHFFGFGYGKWEIGARVLQANLGLTMRPTFSNSPSEIGTSFQATH